MGATKRIARELIPTIKDVVYIVLAVPLVLASLATIFNEPVKWYAVNYLGLEERGAGGPCVIIPEGGHYVQDAEIGGTGDLVWRNVNRLRADCGVPRLTAVVSNGLGFLHDVGLSITGVALPVGVTPELKYQYRLPDSVTPGRARLRVYVTFPDAVGGAPTAFSPWVDFQILG